MLKLVIIWCQAATFVAAGIVFMCEGNPRLGLAQMCLGIVTALVYL